MNKELIEIRLPETHQCENCETDVPMNWDSWTAKGTNILMLAVGHGVCPTCGAIAAQFAGEDQEAVHSAMEQMDRIMRSREYEMTHAKQTQLSKAIRGTFTN